MDVAGMMGMWACGAEAGGDCFARIRCLNFSLKGQGITERF